MLELRVHLVHGPEDLGSHDLVVSIVGLVVAGLRPLKHIAVVATTPGFLTLFDWEIVMVIRNFALFKVDLILSLILNVVGRAPQERREIVAVGLLTAGLVVIVILLAVILSVRTVGCGL